MQLCGVKANICCLPQQLSIFSESGSLPNLGITGSWTLSSRGRAGSMSPVLCCGPLCGCWGSLVVQGLYPLIESPGPIEHNMLFRKLQLWTWTHITALPCPGLCGRAGGSGERALATLPRGKVNSDSKLCDGRQWLKTSVLE